MTTVQNEGHENERIIKNSIKIKTKTSNNREFS